MPVTLPVPGGLPVRVGDLVALRSSRNDLLAVMQVEEKHRWDLETEARCVYGTMDPQHPLVAEMATRGRWYLSGPLEVLNLSKHYSFVDLRHTPCQVRSLLESVEAGGVVAF